MINFDKKPPAGTTLFAGNSQYFAITTNYLLSSTVRCAMYFYTNSAKTKLLFAITETKSLTAGSVSFDLSSYMLAFLQAQPRTFDFGALAVQHFQSTANYVYFRCEFAQIDQQGAQVDATIAEEYRVIKATTAINTDYFVAFVENYAAFLTFVPQPARISARSGVFFSYYNAFARTAKLYCKFYFSGNTTSTAELALVTLAEGVYHIYYSYSELETAAAMPFQRCEFWFQNNLNAAISNLIKFEPDTEAHQFERILIVENSLGGLDFFRLLGKISDESKYNRLESVTDAEIRNNYTERMQTFSANTGFFENGNFKNEEFKNWFAGEIMPATQAYLLTTERLTEVRITTDSATSYADGEFVTSENLKLENVRILTSFTTPAIDLPDTGEAPSGNYYNSGYINTGFYGTN